MTKAMRLGSVFGAGALCGLLIQAVPSSAQLTPDECKCQQGTSAAQGKFTADKAKCITKCEQGARKSLNPSTDCNPPYGGATATCIAKAEGKAESSEVKKCQKDCPECYSGGNCAADAMTRTANTEAAIDSFKPIIYCDDTGSVDQLNPKEAKCQDTTAKNAASFARTKAKCYQKCRAAECKGQIPAGSCTGGAVTDPTGKTQACINKAETKCSSGIDKACESASGGDKPECYGTTSGTQRCNQIEQVVDAFDATFYCASPSGAFLD